MGGGGGDIYGRASFVILQIRCKFPAISYLSETQKNNFQFLKKDKHYRDYYYMYYLSKTRPPTKAPIIYPNDPPVNSQDAVSRSFLTIKRMSGKAVPARATIHPCK